MKIVLTIILAFYLSCGGSNQPSVPIIESRNGVDISRAMQQKTLKGATVYSVSGLPTSSLDLIDAGISRVFANAAGEGYQNQVNNYSYFTIYVPIKPCQLSPTWKVPCFRVHAPEYTGTPYDIGNGDVLAAELVLSDSEFVLCPDEQYMSDSAAWGTEHIIIKLNDPPYYEQTKTHLTGGHPLLPKPKL